MKERADILASLRRDIYLLQGHKSLHDPGDKVIGLGPINQSFPDANFPIAGVHEFFSNNMEEKTAASAFVASILSSFTQKGGAILWVSSSRRIFPPALKWFGISPDRVFFLDLKKEKEVSWAMEEALKCNALAAVVGEMQEMNFTASRRFQLAIEKSGVSCFVLRYRPKNVTTAAITRWQIKPLKSGLEDGMPGVGYPRWQVTLLKVRNGKAGTWNMEWANGSFRHVSKLAVLYKELQKKTG